MNTTTATTIDTFRKACNNLAEAVNRQLFEGSRSFYWIGDEAGGLCDFDDCDVLKPEDMVRILESGMTYDDYAAWRDANTDNTQYINLASWLKGLRHGMIDSQPREPLTERISEEARRAFVKSLWHDAEEEAVPDKSIVALHEHGDDIWILSGLRDWKYYVEYYDIARWAYLDDILPEKGGRL